MPNGFNSASYMMARQARAPKAPKHTRPTGNLTSPVLPMPDMSKPGSLTPKSLLQHENRFDPNIFTPEQLQQKPGFMQGRSEEISKA
jgi:hypothetical protein